MSGEEGLACRHKKIGGPTTRVASAEGIGGEMMSNNVTTRVVVAERAGDLTRRSRGIIVLQVRNLR